MNLEGDRDVLGMWFQRTEGAKFWLAVLTDLKTRGVQDVLVCCVDGLTGFPEAIEAVYPQAWVQTCLVHLVRSSLRFVPYKDKRKVAADLKKIYTAVDRDHAESALERFAETWDGKYPMISASSMRTGNRSSISWPSRPTSAAPSTPRTRSRRSTARSAKSSRPAAASPTKTPPASCSTSRSRAPNRNGGTPTTGAQPSQPSESTSATASPTLPDCYRKFTVTH